ncbi:MAG: cytochrome P450, partial [Nannocystaceae bacterium]|nr:cytochrome P450 [Nannocystaceae bacterium]
EGDLPGDDFLIATIKEAMRLYPPGWILGREASEDTVLGGFRIQKGSFLMYSAWVTHRRSDLWEAPSEFRPSRFLERARPAGADFAYFPFGLPPNHCIGAGFALLQARAAVAKILMNFEVQPIGAPPLPVAEATVRPSRPVVVSLRPLQKSDPDAEAGRLSGGGALVRPHERYEHHASTVLDPGCRSRRSPAQLSSQDGGDRAWCA